MMKMCIPEIAWGHDLALWAPQPTFFLSAPRCLKEHHTPVVRILQGVVGPGSLANIYRADPSYLTQLGSLQVLPVPSLEVHLPLISSPSVRRL